MEDEAQEVQETVEATQEETTQETVNNTSDEKPAGYLPIDPKTASPEQVQARLDYLYRQVKDNGRTLNEYRTIAQQQSQQIEDLMSGVGKVVDHLETSSNAATEASLQKNMKAALEAGDTDLFLAEQNKLLTLKAKQLNAKQERPQKQTQTQQKSGVNASQMAQEAEMDGELAPEDARFVEAWQDERDQMGKPLRPWAYDTHPQFQAGLAETTAVMTNPSYEHLTFQQKLQEVDRRMGVKKTTGSQNVMGGSLTTPGKKQTIVISSKAEEIARRTKFAGPGKTDAEHIAAYRKQIEKSQSTNRGSR